MVRKPNVAFKNNLRGGSGEIEFRYVLSSEELMGHGPTYAKVILRPGCSIGWHQHIGTKEPYFVISGMGRFTDNDGTATIVGPDDVCTIDVNESHSIENISETEDLVLMALVLNER